MMPLRPLLASLLTLVLAATLPAAEAGGRRSASPKGGTSPSVARSAPSRPAAAGTTRAVTRGTARGRATYGYGYPVGYPPAGWDGWGGWYGPYWGWGGFWYPTFYGPYWGWPYVDATLGIPGAVPAALPGDAPGSVETVVAPKSATLRVDGEDLGRAKDFNGTWDSLRLPPGTHVLEFSREGYQTFRAVVDVRPGRTYRVERELRRGSGLDPDSDPLPTPDAPVATASDPARSASGTPAAPGALVIGLLDLTVRPEDAAVYLDGTFFATGEELNRLHGAIPVAAGTHRLEVARPGHVTRTLVVQVVAGGAPTSVEVTLDPER